MMFNVRRLKMNRSAFSALFVATALTGNLHDATGQMINPTVQTTSPRVVAGRSAPATAAKPGATGRVAPQIGPRPTGLNPQRFNANQPRTIAQPPANLQRTYAPPIQTSNPAFAALNVQRSAPGQQAITVDPATRQTELRTLAAMRQRRGVVTRDGNILDPATRQNELPTLATMREPRTFGDNNQTLATINPQRHITNRDPEAGPQRDRHESQKDAPDKKWRHKKDHISHDEAF